MSSSAKTLLDYLQRKNPTVRCVRYRKVTKTNTTSAAWRTPESILKWDEFNFASLQTMYGGYLREALCHQYNDLRDYSNIPDYPLREIYDEDSFTSLIVSWNQAVVNNALAESQGFIQKCQERNEIFMAKGAQADYPGSNSQFRPDWAGTQPNEDQDNLPRNVLPGDSKMGRKFRSRLIETGDLDDLYLESDWMEPLKQVYNYCLQAKVRYGYILTEKEIIVLRIRPASETHPSPAIQSEKSSFSTQGSVTPKASAAAETTLEAFRETPATKAMRAGILEFKPITWKAGDKPDSNGQRLTINLALWWLHMMAMENSTIEDTYLSLRSTPWGPPPASCSGRNENHIPSNETRIPTPSAQQQQQTSGRKRKKSFLPDSDDEMNYLPTPKATPRQTRSMKRRQQE